MFSAINFGMNQQQFMGSQQSLNLYQQQHQQQYNRNNYEFHQMQTASNQQQQLSQQQQREQRINQLSGRCGTGSVSSIHSLQSCTGKIKENRSLFYLNNFTKNESKCYVTNLTRDTKQCHMISYGDRKCQ